MQDSLSGYGRLRGAERNSERLLLPGDVCLRGQQANARQQVLLCGDLAAAPTLATRTAAVDTAVASVDSSHAAAAHAAAFSHTAAALPCCATAIWCLGAGPQW